LPLGLAAVLAVPSIRQKRTKSFEINVSDLLLYGHTVWGIALRSDMAYDLTLYTVAIAE